MRKKNMKKKVKKIKKMIKTMMKRKRKNEKTPHKKKSLSFFAYTHIHSFSFYDEIFNITE